MQLPLHEFLSPTALRKPGDAISRILMVGSCSAELYAAWKGLPCELDFIFSNNLASLPEAPPHAPAEYNLQVVQIPMRSLIGDSELWDIGYDEPRAHEDLFKEVCDRLSLQLDAASRWNATYGLLSFICNFMVPLRNPLGRALPRYDYRNPVFFVEKLNEFLVQELSARKNCFVLDVDQISAALGRALVQEDSIGWLAHGGPMPDLKPDGERLEPLQELIHYYQSRAKDFVAAVWLEIDALYRSIRQIDPVKLIVVDLDDTLWSGIAGESESPGPHMIEDSYWPMGMMEALKVLKKRGTILAIASRNDPQRIKEIFPKIFGNRLRLDDFGVVQISWRPKAESMREILAQTNLLPRNTLFVDDNPVERDAMQSEFPDIRVLGGAAYLWKRTLLWSAETEAPSITTESANRTKMIQAQVRRETTRKELSRDEFLKNLNLKVILFELEQKWDGRKTRAFELLNKTNQFNTTGERWTREQFDAREGLRVFCFEVEDKFTAYGLVGVLLIKANTILQFVMSCRVAGLGIEEAVIPEIHRLFGGQIKAITKDTDANSICRDIYTRSGFSKSGDIWLSGYNPAPWPDHVKIETGDGVVNA